MADIILVVAGTLAALLAGLFFGFQVAVMPGLARSSDREFLRAMQNINRVIVNPVFLLSFLGPIVLLPIAAWLNWEKAGWLLVAASVAHIVGGVGITGSRNIPLNNRLDALDLDAQSDADVGAFRKEFEKPWNQWHLMRTVATILATVAAFVAALQS